MFKSCQHRTRLDIHHAPVLGIIVRQRDSSAIGGGRRRQGSEPGIFRLGVGPLARWLSAAQRPNFHLVIQVIGLVLGYRWCAANDDDPLAVRKEGCVKNTPWPILASQNMLKSEERA